MIDRIHTAGETSNGPTMVGVYTAGDKGHGGKCGAADEETMLLQDGLTAYKSASRTASGVGDGPPGLWFRVARILSCLFVGFILGVLITRDKTMHHHGENLVPNPNVVVDDGAPPTAPDAPGTSVRTGTYPNAGTATTTATTKTTVDLLPATGTGTSKYDKFQALNFQLYSGGAPVETGNATLGTNKPNPECSDLTLRGVQVDEMQCYMGHKDRNKDVSDRLAIMEEALEKAYQVSDKSAETLKIFLAPEFFFRGRNGAYMLDPNQTNVLFNHDGNDECSQEICQILSALERIVANKKFKDWLFMFGTIVAAEVLPEEDTYDYLFYNFAVLYKGYDPSQATHIGKRFLVPKRYVSNIDFLTPYREQQDHEEIYESDSPYERTVDNPYEKQHKMYDRRIWHKYKDEIASLGYIMIEYGWFQLDGVTFSVEVCLDHAKSSAATTYLADSAVASSSAGVGTIRIPSVRDEVVNYIPIPRHQAQVSLVVSAGLDANPQSLVLANGGTLILQDGLGDEPMVMKWDRPCFLAGWVFEGGTQVIKRTPSITPTDVVFHYELNLEFRKEPIYDGAKYWKDSLRGVFSTALYEPMMLVFSPAKIALLAD